MLRFLFTLSVAFCCIAIGLVSYDTIVEVNAEIPRRVDVSISKEFGNVELTSSLYEKDLVFPGGIHVEVVSNLPGAFEVILFSPKREGFCLVGNGHSEITFFLREVKNGKRVSVGDVLYSKGKRA